VVVVLKGYPRLSETFIAQEILGLERAGLDLAIVALRRPTDEAQHSIHREIRASTSYLPEYLHDEPFRVMRGLGRSLVKPGFPRAVLTFIRDLRQDFTRNRWRRFGQAMVLASELPADTGWLYAHFIHTPASVTAYASLISGVSWSCSAHAKDIWTSPDWDLSEKLKSSQWVVTCTRVGFEKLLTLSAADRSKVSLIYHGLDLQRFGKYESREQQRDGRDPANPVIIASVGRAVPKKGYDVLLRALALVDPALSFRFIHIGEGEQLPRLKALADREGLSTRVEWKGAQTQDWVLKLFREADLFALACRVTADGDRDGLPNVIVEACSQGLPCVSTRVSGIPELLTHERDGLLAEPDNPEDLAKQLSRLISDPVLRLKLGRAAEIRARAHFDHQVGIGQLLRLFEAGWHQTT
jgi:glycosyltransferase involved in cell wall biosynthesis